MLIVSWNSWPLGTGGWPIWPAATWMFCCSIALTTSVGGQVARRQLLRVEPDPHAVVALAEVGDVADAVEPGQLVLDLDRGVVAQVEVVVRLPSGENRLTIIRMLGDFFLTVTPRRLTRSGRTGSASDDAVLHQHLGHVQVGAELEGDGQRVGAVVGALRRHVHHALDAVDLLLDRRGHGVGHDLGVGAGIVAPTPAPSAA